MGKTWPLFLQIKHSTQNSSKIFLNYKIIFWNMSGVPFRCVMILQKFNFHLGVNEMLNKWRFSFKKIVLVLKLTQYLTNDFLKYEWGCLVDGQFWFRLFNFHRKKFTFFYKTTSYHNSSFILHSRPNNFWNLV